MTASASTATPTPEKTDTTEKKIIIGMLAGESSGDVLGAGLISEIRNKYPNAEFVGIGGPLMQKQSLSSLFDMERLSVMGFVEPIKRLPELLRIRSAVVDYFKQNPPDIFIGIDSPDFNLGVEKRLKRFGIKTMHYVSPSVWAWRQGRIKKIKAAVDHMLCVLPFEADFYEQHGVPVTFVGHPMADDIKLSVNRALARKRLGIDENQETNSGKIRIAVLPGSRAKEVEFLAPLFFEVCQRVNSMRDVEFLVAASSDVRYQRLQELAAQHQVDVRMFKGGARDVLYASDLALAASGTVTLEAMLTKTPMVVAYKLEKFTFWLVSRMVKVTRVALPNILVDRELVKEFIQDAATPESITPELISLIDDVDRRTKIVQEFLAQHRRLRQGASKKAAAAVLTLIGKSV